MNGMMTVRSALVEDTVKNRTGVAKRPRDHPLRSNSSRASAHHEEQRHAPTPRAAGNPTRSAKTQPSHPHHRRTSTHPLCVPDTNPPAAGQTPSTTIDDPQDKATWHPLPAAGVLKARCKRHTGNKATTPRHPKVFGGKLGKGPSLRRRSRTQKMYKQQRIRSVLKTPKRLRMTVRHVRSRA